MRQAPDAKARVKAELQKERIGHLLELAKLGGRLLDALLSTAKLDAEPLVRFLSAGDAALGFTVLGTGSEPACTQQSTRPRLRRTTTRSSSFRGRSSRRTGSSASVARTPPWRKGSTARFRQNAASPAVRNLYSFDWFDYDIDLDKPPPRVLTARPTSTTVAREIPSHSRPSTASSTRTREGKCSSARSVSPRPPSSFSTT